VEFFSTIHKSNSFEYPCRMFRLKFEAFAVKKSVALQAPN